MPHHGVYTVLHDLGEAVGFHLEYLPLAEEALNFPVALVSCVSSHTLDHLMILLDFSSLIPSMANYELDALPIMKVSISLLPEGALQLCQAVPQVLRVLRVLPRHYQGWVLRLLVLLLSAVLHQGLVLLLCLAFLPLQWLL